MHTGCILRLFVFFSLLISSPSYGEQQFIATWMDVQATRETICKGPFVAHEKEPLLPFQIRFSTYVTYIQ